MLILVPGSTISTYERQINSFIDNNDVIVISVNFVSAYKDSWAFYGNKKDMKMILEWTRASM